MTEPSPALYCSICFYVRAGEANPAILVLNGQSVCEDHAAYVQGNPHAAAIAAAAKDEQAR